MYTWSKHFYVLCFRDAVELNPFSSHSQVNMIRIPNSRPKTGLEATEHIPGPLHWSSRQGCEASWNSPWSYVETVCGQLAPLLSVHPKAVTWDGEGKTSDYSLFYCWYFYFCLGPVSNSSWTNKKALLPFEVQIRKTKDLEGWDGGSNKGKEGAKEGKNIIHLIVEFMLWSLSSSIGFSNFKWPEYE